jgi:enoyl-CoA hydratase
MSYETILLEQENGVTTITINRPKAMNALNGKVLEELTMALNQIDGDENVRVLVLTGAGDKAFVAGADITELATFNSLQAKFFAQKGHAVMNKIGALAIPAIAAVNGYALGGGCEMALACDFIYASENAAFGLPEITLGLIPGFGGTQRLSRAIGAPLAKEMVYTGKMIKAAEAKTIGLVNQVFPPEALLEGAMKTAQAIAKKGKVSLRAAKQTINNGLNADLATGLSIEQDAFALCMASEDAKEGTGAFLEKRKPQFSGELGK